MKKIQTTQPFTVIDNGEMFSPACGSIVEVEDALATTLIGANMAVLYELVDPEGTIKITANGTHDVTNYESAKVSISPVFSTLWLSNESTQYTVRIIDYSTDKVPYYTDSTLLPNFTSSERSLSANTSGAQYNLKAEGYLEITPIPKSVTGSHNTTVEVFTGTNSVVVHYTGTQDNAYVYVS